MSVNPKNAGVILAGGEGRRMGGKEKAFLKVCGAPLIEYVLASLKQVFSELIIVANRPRLYQGLPAMIVSDLERGRGPLMGIYSALRASSADHIFVIACDMIFVQPDFIRMLLSVAQGYDFVLPGITSQERYEPLHAVYSRACLPVMESFYMDKGRNLRILDLMSRVRTRVLAPEEFAAYDPYGLAFININLPEDLAWAESFWRYYRAGEKFQLKADLKPS